MTEQTLNISEIRERLKSQGGRKYWRSLEELADSPAFQEYMAKEFPSQESNWIDPVTRRNFLKLMGASMALSGLTACVGRPSEKIVPYVNQPEEVIPGRPLYFSTAMPLGGYGYPLLVENHMGRPTKIEGNPEHPASLGAAYAIQQAAVLSLYDPDRSRTVVNMGTIRGWPEFTNALDVVLGKQRANGGAGLRLLTEAISSPTLADQINKFLKDFPQAKWTQYEPCGRENAAAAARQAFGQDAEVRYDFSRADVVFSLDADFMGGGPGGLRYAKDFSKRRRVRNPDDGMSRLYALETSPSPTGTKADHRLAMRASEIEDFARAAATALGVQAGGTSYGKHQKWINGLVRDLQAKKGKSIVIAGDHMPPVVHALALAMNQQLGNIGATVIAGAPVLARAAQAQQNQTIAELAAEMESGAIKVLLVLGGNPIFNAPHDLKLGEKFKKVEFAVRMGLYEDETSRYCHWHVPEAHFLESWGDIRSYDGSASIIQPLIAPLYQGHTAYEILALLTGTVGQSTYDIVQAYWKQAQGGKDFDKFWRKALHDGIVPDSALPVKEGLQANAPADALAPKPKATGDYEIVFRADPAVYDGRFANNGWLQEMPKPFTKITWDNIALISPKTAEALKVEHRDLSAQIVRLTSGPHKIEIPVFIQPGCADGCVTVFLGGGREMGGIIATGRAPREGTEKAPGFNTYLMRTAEGGDVISGVKVESTSRWYEIARTQLHHNIDDTGVPVGHESLDERHLVQTAALEEYRKRPDFARKSIHTPAEDNTLYAGAWDYKNPKKEYLDRPYSWGMSIDISACIGCGACVVACMSENNVPIVGKKEVRRQHEMHWLRVDQYYWGELDNPKFANQPLPCMHCETAPCEVVCPVGATTHSSEGLNDMVYNRCVGTRFCANNCPYKVRRFNWFAYSDFKTPQMKLLNNPDVTVRSRGVMEKCTYCVQRINHARIQASNENRRIRDGEVVTACEATCPVDAIVFGDINDPESRVHQLKQNGLDYGLLTDLNTRPRTTYMAAVVNPNPEVEEA